MLCIGCPADDYMPNAKMGSHRKPSPEARFRNGAPKNYANLHSGKRLKGILQELTGIIADLQDA